MGAASGWPYIFGQHEVGTPRVTCSGWPFFYVVIPSQDKLSARTAAGPLMATLKEFKALHDVVHAALR